VRDTPFVALRLNSTMETMHAAGRRTLPPVPRPGRGRTGTAEAAGKRLSRQPIAPGSVVPEPPAPPNPPAGPSGPDSDAAQQFVERLRSAAADFAAAAGAESAVVPEAVPPARHRRSRCRIVLRYADDSETDVTFLGPAGEPGAPSRHGFDRQIRRWLGDGQQRDDAWLVVDPDASDGVAIDMTAWVPTS
jgi:hypothetical protein